MADDSLLGATLDGRYRVRRLIGSGGMGSVYEAEHVGTGRRVAVKVILTGDLAKNEALVARFQREAKAAGSVDTQHIAQVLDTGRDGATGLPFMVMEFLVGEDVQDMLKRTGAVSPGLALKIVAQTCLGFVKAHEARVIHRDIKPANLFLAKRDEGELVVKVLDFGIAKIKQDVHVSTGDTGGLTRTGSMLGSPLYMSPEQARGQKTIDHRADLWSLGIVLFQLLTGRTPHDEIEGLGELIIAICSDGPPPVQDLAPWVPPEVAAIVHNALRIEAGDRFQTAATMLDAIRPLLPRGLTILESEIVSIRDDERANVVPRVTISRRGSITPPPAGPNASAPAAPNPPTALGPPAAPDAAKVTTGGASRDRVTTAARAGTNDGVARSQQSPPKGSSSRLPLAIGAVVAIGAGAFGALRLLPRPDAAPPLELTQAALSVQAPPPEPPPPSAAPAPASNERTVKVTIAPADATVEVNGKPATLDGGAIEIMGALGSVHRVRVTAGSAEVRKDVVVTDSGALPSKIELAPAKDTKPAASASARGARR